MEVESFLGIFKDNAQDHGKISQSTSSSLDFQIIKEILLNFNISNKFSLIIVEWNWKKLIKGQLPSLERSKLSINKIYSSETIFINNHQ